MEPTRLKKASINKTFLQSSATALINSISLLCNKSSPTFFAFSCLLGSDYTFDFSFLTDKCQQESSLAFCYVQIIQSFHLGELKMFGLNTDCLDIKGDLLRILQLTEQF